MANAAPSSVAHNPNLRTHTGGCHCGAVRYQAVIDATHGTRCNCTICTKLATLGVIIKPDAFKLLAGEDALSHYSRHPEIAFRHFCKHCGVHCYGNGTLEILGGAFVSVNMNTLDDLDPSEVSVLNWDGRHDNWQAGPRPTPWPVRAVEPSAA